MQECKTLSMLGQLSKLEVLYIHNLRGVKSIGEEFYGNYRDSKTLFPKFKIFEILRMVNLEQWKDVATVMNCTAFPHLESLTMCSCLKLTNIPNIFATHS